MIKTISLIKRRMDLDRIAFRNHYESVHAPLALPYMKGLLRYVRYHVEEELVGDLGCDVFSAFWYRDAESVAALMSCLEAEEGRPLLEDELKFMDKAANRFFSVSERTLVSGEEGDKHLFILVAKPSSMSRYDASSQLANDHWPELEKGLEQTSFVLLRDAFPLEGSDVPWSALFQIRALACPGLSAWAEARIGEGWRVKAASTRRFETELLAE